MDGSEGGQQAKKMKGDGAASQGQQQEGPQMSKAAKKNLKRRAKKREQKQAD
jgi:hypothetical protein